MEPLGRVPDSSCCRAMSEALPCVMASFATRGPSSCTRIKYVCNSFQCGRIVRTTNLQILVVAHLPCPSKVAPLSGHDHVPKLRRREYERPSTRLRHPQLEDWSPHHTLELPLQQALHRETIVKPCSMTPVTEPVGRDVVIIGGGICGILAARECQKRGLTYAILEKEPQLGGNWYTKANAHSYLQVTAGWVGRGSLAGGCRRDRLPNFHQIYNPLDRRTSPCTVGTTSTGFTTPFSARHRLARWVAGARWGG